MKSTTGTRRARTEPRRRAWLGLLFAAAFAPACEPDRPPAGGGAVVRDAGPGVDGGGVDAGRDGGGPDGGRVDGGDASPCARSWCNDCDYWCAGLFNPRTVYVMGDPRLESEQVQVRAYLDLNGAGQQEPAVAARADFEDAWVLESEQLVYLRAGEVFAFVPDPHTVMRGSTPRIALDAAEEPDTPIGPLPPACVVGGAGNVAELHLDPERDQLVVACPTEPGGCAPDADACEYYYLGGGSEQLTLPDGWRLRQLGYGDRLLRDPTDGALAIERPGQVTLDQRGLGGDVLAVRADRDGFYVVLDGGGGAPELELWDYGDPAQPLTPALEAVQPSQVLSTRPDACAIAASLDVFCSYRAATTGNPERIYRHRQSATTLATSVFDGGGAAQLVLSNAASGPSPFVIGLAE